MGGAKLVGIVYLCRGQTFGWSWQQLLIPLFRPHCLVEVPEGNQSTTIATNAHIMTNQSLILHIQFIISNFAVRAALHLVLKHLKHARQLIYVCNFMYMLTHLMVLCFSLLSLAWRVRIESESWSMRCINTLEMRAPNSTTSGLIPGSAVKHRSTTPPTREE